MNSSDEPSGPTRAPLHATNSWVISHARELIDYDKHDAILQWLEDVPNDEDKLLQGNSRSDAGKSSKHAEAGSSVRGHPAGEIEDYDRDCFIFSQKSIIERLEDAAAAMDGMSREYDGDTDGEDDTESCSSASFVTASEHLSQSSSSSDSGVSSYHTLTSDPGTSAYQSRAPDSLEEFPLFEEQKTNLGSGSEVGSEAGSEGTVIYRPLPFSALVPPVRPREAEDVAPRVEVRSHNTASNSMTALPSVPSSNARPLSEQRTRSDFDSGNQAHNNVGIMRAGSRSKVLGSLSKLFTSMKPSKFKHPKPPSATAAQPAASAEPRNSKLKLKLKPKSERNRLRKKPKTYHFYEHPPAFPEIERCASPFPSMRPPHHPRPPTPYHTPTPTPTPIPSILAPTPRRSITPSAPPGVFRATPGSTPRIWFANGNTIPYAPSTPLLRFSTHGGDGTRAAAVDREREIVCPVPQAAGRLFVPGPSWNQVRVSPLATRRVEGEIPVISVLGVQGGERPRAEGALYDDLD